MAYQTPNPATETKPSSISTASPTCHGTGPTTDIEPAATGPPESSEPAAATAPTAGSAAPSAAARSAALRSERPTMSRQTTPAATGIARTRQSHGEPGPACGTACKSGSPGRAPCTEPRGETELPSPTANPGPAA